MPRPNPPVAEAQRIVQRALGQLGPIRTAARAFCPGQLWVERDGCALLERFLTRHRTRAPTRAGVALHEAGHFVAFKRLGMAPIEAEFGDRRAAMAVGAAELPTRAGAHTKGRGTGTPTRSVARPCRY
jgi:hypothetical protein